MGYRSQVHYDTLRETCLDDHGGFRDGLVPCSSLLGCEFEFFQYLYNSLDCDIGRTECCQELVCREQELGLTHLTLHALYKCLRTFARDGYLGPNYSSVSPSNRLYFSVKDRI